jgi:nucleoside-diphosphate-sugar epimerase
MRQRVLIVGCGDVGLRLAQQLGGRFSLIGVVRGNDSIKLAALRAAGVRPLRADLGDRRSLRRLSALAPRVVHLAPPPAEGALDSRTRNLLAALSARVRTLVYVSTTGVYGDCGGAFVPETRPRQPQSARARRRVDAERRLRRWGRRGRRVAILRAPGIYAADRLPDARVRQGLPALLPAEDIYTNHIHADDLARLAWQTLWRGRAQRVYNAVDHSGLKMGDWFDVVADHLHLPRPPRLPRDAVLAAVTPAMRTFLAESRRLSNTRIVHELAFRFRYPTVRSALKSTP